MDNSLSLHKRTVDSIIYKEKLLTFEINIYYSLFKFLYKLTKTLTFCHCRDIVFALFSWRFVRGFSAQFQSFRSLQMCFYLVG